MSGSLIRLIALKQYSSHTVKFFANAPYSTCQKVKSLKDIIGEKIPCAQEKIKEFRKKHGKKKVGEINVDMIYGGMRGMTALICETSDVAPDKGVRFRGRTIEDCQTCLPRASEDGQPLPESVFWLLCTGDIPTAEEVSQLSADWGKRAKLPQHVTDMLKNMPKDMHPMAQLSCAVCALSHESVFAQEYTKGIEKSKYWEFVYEDASNLIAKLPLICSTIYKNIKDGGGDSKNKCQKKNDDASEISPSLDWTGNFMKMMGFDDPTFVELMRLYMVLHCDHEGGNVSAHTVNVVGSALADPYLAYAAGMNGLAGPLHGLANQEVLNWITKMQEEIGCEPEDAKIKEYVEKTLKSGKVVPGYGHAVLRVTDPRYTAFYEFGKKNKADDELVKIVGKLLKIVPEVLKASGKAKNPFPNVDGSSGALLSAYGLKEMRFYTVLFAMSRSLGTMAQLIWARAIGLPIERPKSVQTNALIDLVEAQEKSSKAKDDKKKDSKAK